MPDTTDCVSLPYPIGTDRLDFAGDLRRLAEAVDAIMCEGVWSPGDLKPTIASVAPTGWLLLDGRTIVDGQTLYADLYNVAPASWKNGPDLVLPNMTARTLLGGGTPGSLGGANSRTLSVANLPVHDHGMAHNHPIDHNHPPVNTSTENALDQQHWMIDQGNFQVAGVAANQGNTAYSGLGTHRHTVDIPAFDGNSGASSQPRTGDAGSGSALDTTPSHMRANWLVKT